MNERMNEWMKERNYSVSQSKYIPTGCAEIPIGLEIFYRDSLCLSLDNKNPDAILK